MDHMHVLAHPAFLHSLRSLRTADSECVFEFIDEVEPIALNNAKTLNRFVGLLRQWLESQSVRCSHTDLL